MKRTILAILVLCITLTGLMLSSNMLKAEQYSPMDFIDIEEDEPITIIMKNGDKYVVYIIKQSKGILFVQNFNDQMQVSVNRSNIAKMRTPTSKELQKTQKKLGMLPEPKTTD